MRECSKCKKYQPDDYFIKHGKRRCFYCRKEYSEKFKKRNIENKVRLSFFGEYYTISEVAKFLSVKSKTLLHWYKINKINIIDCAGIKIISKEEFDKIKPPDNMRRCCFCFDLAPLIEFNDKVRNCKLCTSNKNKNWRTDNPERDKEYKKQYAIDNKEKIKQYREENKEKIKENGRLYQIKHRKRLSKIKGDYCRKHAKRLALLHKTYLYDITLEKYQKMIENCNNLCSICYNDMKEPYIDHNHETNKIRGLLCRDCNLGIGCLYDNIDFIKNSINYLTNNKNYIKIDNIYINDYKKCCCICGLIDSKENFYIKSGKYGICKNCKDKTKYTIKEYTKSKGRMSRYFICDNKYKELLIKRNNCCDICNRKMNKLCIDHCHNKGFIRGILCINCNSAIGLLKENITLLVSSILYLKREF